MFRIALITFSIFLASPVVATESFICEGEVGNGYLPENVRYQTYGDRTFFLTIECDWWIHNVQRSGECNYSFNGSRHVGFLYSNGDFVLSHLGPFNSLSKGTLSFKMSESTNGVSGNEGQRWFRGFCREAS